RDMRFRKDQSPYQTMAAARFPHRAWKERAAPGMYLHLDPAHNFFACGLWRPDTDTRSLVREAIMSSPERWKRASRGKVFQSIWELWGDSGKGLPAGCDKNHPFASDLMRKDFIGATCFTEAQVCGPDFLKTVARAARAAGPFLEFLTRALGLPWSANDR